MKTENKNVTVKFGNHCEVEMPDSCFEATGQAYGTCRVGMSTT